MVCVPEGRARAVCLRRGSVWCGGVGGGPRTRLYFHERPGNGTSPRGVCAVLCGRFHYGVTGDLRFLRQTEYILNARAAQPSRFSVLLPHSLCATSIPLGSSVVVT